MKGGQLALLGGSRKKSRTRSRRCMYGGSNSLSKSIPLHPEAFEGGNYESMVVSPPSQKGGRRYRKRSGSKRRTAKRGGSKRRGSKRRGSKRRGSKRK